MKKNQIPKPRKQRKLSKLSVNRETLRHLSEGQLHAVGAGLTNNCTLTCPSDGCPVTK